MIRTTTRAAAIATLLCTLLAACGPLGLIKGKDEPQDVVNQHVVGMQVGDFFQRYGRPGSRREELDGSTTYDWESSIGPTPPGENSLDERTCRLRLSADRRGKITTALVTLDNIGRVSTSRCKEMFIAG